MRFDDLPPRIREKVEMVTESGCWIWMGALSDGYGSVNSKHVDTGKAHRAVFVLLRGALPANLTLDHGCRVRCCVNPDHLKPMPHADNVLLGEGPTAKNRRKTHCKRGHLLPVEPNKGRSRECRSCKPIQDAEWAARNPERVRKHHRAYYERHSEDERERARRESIKRKETGYYRTWRENRKKKEAP